MGRYKRAGVALHEGYGLSETAPVVTTNAVDATGHSRVGRPTAGSIGLPIPGISVELRDTDGTLVEEDDPGLLAVRGDNLFSGYWPDGHGGPDADGWFVTGDLAYADGTGQLFLVGRETDMVLVNGFNVYPAEVESVLRRADGVGAVAVVGVPDEVTGEAVHAYVVPAGGPLQAAAGDRGGGLAAAHGHRQGQEVAAQDHRVSVVTRRGCHLCEDAESVVDQLSRELGFIWDAVDVDQPSQLQDTHRDRVPVILLDGVEHGYWWVEEDRLRQALDQPARPQ